MPGNRVEELERTVTRLESTVNGLTDELVEAKERIRDLEAELEPQPADGATFPEADPEEVREAVAEVERETDGEDPQLPDETDTQPTASDDRFDDVEADPENSEAREDELEEFGDDIIVA
jgi:chromosome segregation ATPase